LFIAQTRSQKDILIELKQVKNKILQEKSKERKSLVWFFYSMTTVVTAHLPTWVGSVANLSVESRSRPKGTW
jgi:hypothetical protein